MKVPGNTVPISVCGATASNATMASVDISPFAVNTTANATYRSNGKYPALAYPSMSGAVVANYAMGSNTVIKSPTEYKFGAYSQWNQDYNIQSTTYTQGKGGGRCIQPMV